MKFGIDKGHNAQYDTGANGIKFEDDLTKEVGDKVIRKLRSLGHTVIDCTPFNAASLVDSLWQRCNMANLNNVDKFVSIHFNLGGGKGSEVYAISGTGRDMAHRVLNQIAALGFGNRGVKDGSRLYVLRNTNAAAILIECAFLDNMDDMRRYDAENMANAIVRGLSGQTAIESPPPIDSSEPTFYVNKDDAELQRNLNRLSIRDNLGNTLVEDGVIGIRTTEAIKRLQSIVGIEVDGLAGPQTWSSINSILIKPLLSLGATGLVVRYLQYRVGTNIDGIFGSITKSAVIRYQSLNTLNPDGIVGNNTWKKLIG